MPPRTKIGVLEEKMATILFVYSYESFKSRKRLSFGSKELISTPTII